MQIEIKLITGGHTIKKIRQKYLKDKKSFLNGLNKSWIVCQCTMGWQIEMNKK